jgi:hypothetical protein
MPGHYLLQHYITSLGSRAWLDSSKNAALTELGQTGVGQAPVAMEAGGHLLLCEHAG